MESVFEYTLGKKAEDTTSAILFYFLKEKKTSKTTEIIRHFLELPEIELKVNSQTSNDAGRFDLKINSLDKKYIGLPLIQ